MPEGEKRRRRGRRAYLNDFHQTADGEYVYTGLMHKLEGPWSRRRVLATLWPLAAASLLSGIAAGCIPAPGTMNSWYVIAPYALSVMSAVSVVWLMCRLTAGGEELRDYVYRATVAQYKLRGGLTAALAALTLVGEAVFLILHGAQGLVGGAVAFVTCLAVELGAVAGWLWSFSRLNW